MIHIFVSLVIVIILVLFIKFVIFSMMFSILIFHLQIFTLYHLLFILIIGSISTIMILFFIIRSLCLIHIVDNLLCFDLVLFDMFDYYMYCLIYDVTLPNFIYEIYEKMYHLVEYANLLYF